MKNWIILYYLSKLLKKARLSSIKNSNVHHTSKIESGCNICSVSMGRYSFCGYNCEIINTEIGAFCSIANNVIIGGAMHPVKWGSTSPVFYKGRDSIKMKFSEHERDVDKKTYIGNDVWIGEGVKIKQGIRIGSGVVIGMGAIVTKDVEPYMIVAGNPAHVIRERFDLLTRNRLLKSKWWNYSDNKLKSVSKYITDVNRFLEELEK